MTNDEKLMQQALKALDWISRAKAMDYEYRIKANEVLPALRARLAQKDEPSAEPCVCGNSIKSNTEHRTDGPCYRKEPSAEPVKRKRK